MMDSEAFTASIQPVDWQLAYSHGQPLLVGRWPTNLSHHGIRSVPFDSSGSSSSSSGTCCSSTNSYQNLHAGCVPPQGPGAPANATTPIIHIPKCRLSFRTAPYDPQNRQHALRDPTVRVEIEEAALHRDFIQGMLANLRPPTSTDGTVAARLSSTAHYDDEDEWVYSRCTLSDFTEMDRDHATFLSNSGLLCCWASVVLRGWEEQDRDGDGGDGRRGISWDLGFMIHRVGLCTEGLLASRQTHGEGEADEAEAETETTETETGDNNNAASSSPTSSSSSPSSSSSCASNWVY